MQPRLLAHPPVTHEGSTLRVGPELVGRRQTTTISFLVDGDRPHLVCTQPVLAQVILTPHDLPDGLSAVWVWAGTASGLAVLLAMAAAVAVKVEELAGAAAGAVAAAGLGVAVVLVVGVELLRERVDRRDPSS